MPKRITDPRIKEIQKAIGKYLENNGLDAHFVLPKPTRREIKVEERKRNLKCPICPPNKGENSKRKPKHGVRKPKKKDKR